MNARAYQSAPRRAGLYALAATSLLALPMLLGAAAHPGQHLDVRIGINEQRVRFEIIVSADLRNLIIRQPFTDFYLDSTGTRFELVSAADYPKAREAFSTFFAQNNAVIVDGEERPAELKQLIYVPNLVQSLTDDPSEFPPDARVVIEYPLAAPAEEIALRWDLYPQDPNRAAFGEDPTLDIVAQLDGYEQSKLIVFKHDDPVYRWTKPPPEATAAVEPVRVRAEPPEITVPVLSGVAAVAAVALGVTAIVSRRRRRVLFTAAGLCVIGGAAAWPAARVTITAPLAEQAVVPDASEAQAVFLQLQRNVYRAFDYKRESDIYDVLAESVAGELLDHVYNEVYQSLVLREHEGAVARVESMEVLASKLTGAPDAAEPAFALRGRWRVQGVVYHWGHLHRRTNEYSALFTIAQRGERWKITAIEEQTGERIELPGDDPPELGPLDFKTNQPPGV